MHVQKCILLQSMADRNFSCTHRFLISARYALILSLSLAFKYAFAFFYCFGWCVIMYLLILLCRWRICDQKTFPTDLMRFCRSCLLELLLLMESDMVNWAAPGPWSWIQSCFWVWCTLRPSLQLFSFILLAQVGLSLFLSPPLPSLSGLRSLLPPCGFHWGTLTPSTSSCPNKCHVTFPRGKVRWYHNTELVTILYACNSVFSFI